MASDNTITVTQDNWKAEVVDSSIPVLVDFWAEWCGPCKAIAPVLDELAVEKDGSLKIGKVNVDEHQMLAGQFGIRSIPTLLLFKNGTVAEQIVGMQTKAQLVAKVDPHL
jgi:thioredoxin 1